MTEPTNLLLIDNYDSFTYNLYDYLLQLGANCEVVRNDAITLAEIEAFAPTALVFSPGPERPAQAGILMDCIRQFHRSVPMLGVCLGHQALGEFFGAELVRAQKPMHGKTSLIKHQGHPLFASLPTSFEVMRYHSLILEAIPVEILEVLAVTEEGEVMAIAHRQFPLIGIQFHPESILSPHGLQILSNWLTFIRSNHRPAYAK
ncbi:MAG: aminodeoxychorismate/anthranilate synthase component II [Phaeodactylibacter sp.]|nr:aminodeoxychorismate/anthranilate synthase component II [Phaeodactylibacter sp.]